MTTYNFRTILLSLFCALLPVCGMSVCADVTSPKAVSELLDRIGGAGTSQRIVTQLSPSMAGEKGADRYTITSLEGKPCIKGSSISAITAGIGYYLNHYAHINLAWNRMTADLSETELPVPGVDETHTCRADYRYYLNYCTFSYSMSVWTWERWQKEIDWMALHGINMPLQMVGLDVVWKRLLTERYGYTPEQANRFVAGPCFQAWWGMNNLEGWGGPNPAWWYDRQAKLAGLIGERERELGMEPVLPGYAGMVPADFTAITGHNAISQGNWCAFVRPYILDPNSESFSRVAADYYDILHQVMGKSSYYSIDPFHEGADISGIDVPAAYASLWRTLSAAAPDASWVIQRWQWSPAQHTVLDKVPKGRLIILDLFSDAHSHFQDYKGHEAVWCMLPNFGGRTGMTGRFNGVLTDYFTAVKVHDNVKGVGATPEGIGQTPVLYDLLFELPWLETSPDGGEWMKNYVRARYGTDNACACEAWELLRNSALNCRSDLQGPHEAVVCARPSLSVDRVSSWGGADIFYDRADVIRAARLLLDARLSGDNYSYDLVDVSRQALTDYSRSLLTGIKDADNAGDHKLFGIRRDAFLQLILDLDRLLNTDSAFMLGHWTEMARAVADEIPGTTDADRNWLELDNARSLITTWGREVNAETGGLRDYSYREWGGMLRDFYYSRWKAWFDNGMKAPDGGWYLWEHRWATDNNLRYSAVSKGNPRDVAGELLGHYLVPITGSEGNQANIDRHILTDLSDVITCYVTPGLCFSLPVAWAEGDAPAMTSLRLDIDGNGHLDEGERLGSNFTIPHSFPPTGSRIAEAVYDDGTVIRIRVKARE